ETFCVTVVTTSHLKVSNQGWYFLGCHECPRKVEAKGGQYECIKKHKTDNPLIKYKVDVEVFDGDETAKFVFWDNPLDDLLGMTAATLLEKMKERGLGDP
ncbi:replication factor-a protein 1 (Rpa1) family protein, partial [Trifolium medium]|nr:replication factor-a protein 1 (Rpa1) family protein [Trifolium medium]